MPGGYQSTLFSLSIRWEREETDRVVNPVLKVLESSSKQTRLESYFMRYEDGIKFGSIKSKRLQSVLKDIQDDKDNLEGIEGGTSNDSETEALGKRQRKV